MFSLKNKVAIITGGGSGIGQATALIFAKQGAITYILDIDEKGCQATLDLISSVSGKGHAKICDLTNHDRVTAIIDSIISEHNQIDILINNAGIAHIGNAENTSIQDFQKLLDVNITSAYNATNACIPHMKANGGSIINIASVAASVGLADRFAYSTTKGALKTMTVSIAKDFIHYNIRCNSISPGRVHTPFVDGFLRQNYPGQEQEIFENLSKTQPIGRMARPEEIAYLALFLASDEASFITGCDYPIDGGFITLNS
jgi:2-keto-3-deoxy-L-fuconate dehydrogenase